MSSRAVVALELKAVLGDLGLAAFPKVSGSKGLQVYVPLNTPVTYEQTGPFARRLATLLERRHPTLVVSDMAKDRRAGKVSSIGVRTPSTRQRSASIRFAGSTIARSCLRR